jgi:ATP-dependent protease ClpP protease subunit
MQLPRFELSGDIEQGAAPELADFLTEHPGPVVLVINSAGGSAPEGAAMAAEIERHGKVTAQVQGIAASAASLVAVACYEIVIHPAAMMMIHEPSAVTGGTADDLREAAAALDKMNLTYAQAYARYTGHSPTTILAWMKAETWLTAEEAIELRFADRMEPVHDPAPIFAKADYLRFSAAPEFLRDLSKKNGWSAVLPSP